MVIAHFRYSRAPPTTLPMCLSSASVAQTTQEMSKRGIDQEPDRDTRTRDFVDWKQLSQLLLENVSDAIDPENISILDADPKSGHGPSWRRLAPEERISV